MGSEGDGWASPSSSLRGVFILIITRAHFRTESITTRKRNTKGWRATWNFSSDERSPCGRIAPICKREQLRSVVVRPGGLSTFRFSLSSTFAYTSTTPTSSFDGTCRSKGWHWRSKIQIEVALFVGTTRSNLEGRSRLNRVVGPPQTVNK